MPSLPECLATCRRDDLRAIATRLAVDDSTLRTKPEWITAITAFWSTGPRRFVTLAALSPAARTALGRLLHYHHIPRLLFLAEFEAIRPARGGYRPTVPPWRDPVTPAEELFYAGLLHSGDTRPLHKAATVTLPDDLRLLLATWMAEHARPEPVNVALAPPSPPTWLALLHDVAHLLVFLQGQTLSGVPLRAGRWLTADALRSFNRRLLRPEPEPLPRSHKRTQRLRYLMFWATAAALHDQNTLTPAGWDWLDQPAGSQLLILWRALQDASRDLRMAFALPDGWLPPPWPQPLWHALAAAGESFTSTTLAAAMLADGAIATAYWFTQFEDIPMLEDMVEDLLAGPLLEFGLLETLPGAAPQMTFYRLSSLGRWLLLTSQVPWPPAPTPLPPIAWQLASEQLTIDLPATLINRGLAEIALFAERVDPPQPAGDLCIHRVRLTPPTLRRAAQADMPFVLLIDSLDAVGVSLPAQAIAQLRSWHAHAGHVRTGVYSVLRTADPAHMAALHATEPLRSHLIQLLSPTAALLDLTPAAVRPLIQDLGFAVDGEAAASAHPPPADAALWLAGQLYAILRRHLPLPMAPPFADLDQLLARLDPAQQAVLHAWRDRLENDLQDLIDGRTFTAPANPSDPAQWIPQIEEAITTHAWLVMLYFSPARNLLTRRHIQPAWFETRRGVLYVLADCQEAGAVVTFRLDRIQELQRWQENPTAAGLPIIA